VGPDGTTLLELSARSPSYRVVKVPEAAFDRAALRATAGRSAPTG
jgi:hypothetical protein